MATTTPSATLPPPSGAPAGWYPDPYTGGLRYYDGRVWTDRWSVAVVEPEPHPTLPMRTALVALVVLLASLIAARVVAEALADRGWPLVALVAVLAVVGYGPSTWWCWRVARAHGGRASVLGLRFRWSDLGWGPLTWLAMLVAQVVAAVIVLLTDVPFASNTEGISDLPVTRSYLVAFLVTAVIAAPVVEEVVFRGVVLRGFLSRLPAAVAIVLQGLVFGVAHVDPSRGSGNIGLAMVLGSVGIALGVVAYALRRIGPTIIAHAIFNGVVLAVALTGVLDDVDSPFDDATVVEKVVETVDVAAAGPLDHG